MGFAPDLREGGLWEGGDIVVELCFFDIGEQSKSGGCLRESRNKINFFFFNVKAREIEREEERGQNPNKRERVSRQHQVSHARIWTILLRKLKTGTRNSELMVLRMWINLLS